MLALLSLRMLPVHVLAMAGIVATGWLGVWQYDVWHDHRAVDAAAITRLPAVPLASVLGPDDPFPADAAGRPVQLEGKWTPEGTVYVDNRRLDGRSGFWVVSPLAPTCQSNANCPAILVVRGWVEEPFADPVAGQAQVVGWLQPSGAGDVAGQPQIDRGDVVGNLDIPILLQQMDRDLYGGYVIARDSGALEQVTPADLPSPPAFASIRNLLYAVEWWVFGAFVVFLWWRWCVDTVADQRNSAAHEQQVRSGS